ncbi:hypothetical protein EJB05_15763, partial [Eragrostis curvula]
MAAAAIRSLRRLIGGQAGMNGRALAIDRQQQLLIDSGHMLMLLGAVILTHQLGAAAAGSGDAEFVRLFALVLWLLGTALAMMSLVARQFPRLAAAGVNLARALRNYLLGGL